MTNKAILNSVGDGITILLKETAVEGPKCTYNNIQVKKYLI